MVDVSCNTVDHPACSDVDLEMHSGKNLSNPSTGVPVGVEREWEPVVCPDACDTSDVHNVAFGTYLTDWNMSACSTGVSAGGRLEGTDEYSIARSLGCTDCTEICASVDGGERTCSTDHKIGRMFMAK